MNGLSPIIVLLVALCGCWAPLQTPDELSSVVGKPADFFVSSAQDPTSPPGSPGGSFNNLTGCWGAFWPVGHNGVPVSIYSVYQFDASANSFSQWTLQMTPLSPILPATLDKDSGSYEAISVGGAQRLRLTTTERFWQEPGATTWTADDSISESDPWVRDILITVRGDQLHIWEVGAGDVPDNGAWWIYTRFSCPE